VRPREDETRDGQPLKDDPVIRQRIAQLATQAEVARCLGLRVVDASVRAEKIEGAPPPTVESSQYKLFATEYSRRLADASMDLGAPGSQLRVRVSPDAPMEGRAESTYRYTSSTPSAAARPRSRRTSSRGAASGCRRTSDVTDARCSTA
jgi:alkylation response protein AidB-like acyl-CoA dehydrogenase